MSEGICYCGACEDCIAALDTHERRELARAWGAAREREERIMSEDASLYRTMPPSQRALHDPHYQKLVSSLRSLMFNDVFTASELQDALDLAQTLNAETQPLYGAWTSLPVTSSSIQPIPETPPRE